jgi:DNA-directed RNA polymerase specialized sigma24 family protein
LGHGKETGRRKKPKEEAFESAIDYCIKNNILSGFLLEHSSEVKNMLLEEWDLEEALAVEREEVRKEDVKKLLKFGGMSPEQISQVLDVPLETVVQYRGEL